MFPYDNSYKQQTNDLLQSLQKQMMSGSITEKHITKVSGKAGAEAYNLPPNSDELLLDLTAPIIWFVQTDGAGYKTLTPYDISQHKEVKQEDVIKSMEDRIAKIEEEIRNGKSYISANNSKSKSGNNGNDAGGRGNDKG